MTLPTNDGDNLQVLTTNGSGVTSWATPSTVATAVPISGLTAAVATNDINNADYSQLWRWTTLTGAAPGLSLFSNSTTASDNAQNLFAVTMSGANATSGQTTYAAAITNNHSGTGSVNVALKLVAGSGVTGNYALIVPPNEGLTGLGSIAPTNIGQVRCFGVDFRNDYFSTTSSSRNV